MPVIEPNTSAPTNDQWTQAYLERISQYNPVVSRPERDVGAAEFVALSTKYFSVYGGLLTHIGQTIRERQDGTGEPDPIARSYEEPDFDIFKWRTPEMLEEHPWMDEFLASDEALDVHNLRTWQYLIGVMDREYRERAILAKHPGWNMVAAGPGIVIDFYAGGKLLKAAGLTIPAIGKAKGIAGVLKGSGTLGASFLAQEQAVRLVTPRKFAGNEWINAAETFGMGAAFGLLGPAANKLGKAVSSRLITRQAGRLAKIFDNPEVTAKQTGMKDAVGAQTDILKEVLADGKIATSGVTADMTASARTRFKTVLEPAKESPPVKLAKELQVIEAEKTAQIYKIMDPLYKQADRVAFADNLSQQARHSELLNSLKGAIERNDVPEVARLAAKLKPELDIIETIKKSRLADKMRAARKMGLITKAEHAELKRLISTKSVAAAKARLKEFTRVSTLHDITDILARTPGALRDLAIIGAAHLEALIRGGVVFTKDAWKKSMKDDLGDIVVPALDKVWDAIGTDAQLGGSMRRAERFLKPKLEPRVMPLLRHPDTEALANEVKKIYGDSVVFTEHPLQHEADWIVALDNMKSNMHGVQSAGATSELAKSISTLVAMATPGGRLRTSPGWLDIRLSRALFSEPTATRTVAEHPATAETGLVAENVMNDYTGLLNKAIYGLYKHIGEHRRAGGKSEPYTLSNGSIVNVGVRKGDTGRAVVDYLRRMDEYAATGGPKPEAPTVVKKIAEGILEYRREMGLNAKDVGLLDFLDPDGLALNRRWLAWKIETDHVRFVDMLYRAFSKNRNVSFKTGEAIDPATRILEEGAIKGLSSEDKAAIAAFTTEGELPPELLNRYLASQDIYLRKAAESTFKTLVSLENDHGILETIEGVPKPLRRKVLEIHETEFAAYLDDDLTNLMTMYHHQVAGRIAIRKALQSDPFWAKLVKDVTGKDLTKTWDPALIMDVIRMDYQRMRDIAVKAGGEKMNARLESIGKALDQTEAIFSQKINEMMGKRPVAADPGHGVAYWVKRNLLKFPVLSSLGKVTLSSLSDVPGTIFYNGMNPAHMLETIKALNLLHEVPLAGREIIYVALNDQLHSMRGMSLAELGEVADPRRFGRGRFGRFLQQTDAGLSYITKQFFNVTLMNQWNRNMKRTVAEMVSQTVIDGARRMNIAGRLMASGMSETEALAKAFEGNMPDAIRMGRLGFNVRNSNRLLDFLYENTVDHTGRKWSNRSAFDTTKHAVVPNYEKLYATDKELFHRFAGAINSETMNTIVEPNLLSKPLMNATWVGRAFNQFQSFNYAWGNQLATAASQRPLIQQLGYVVSAVGISALIDALHNSLSGRRSLPETAELWQTNTAGMAYAAVLRSPLLGWLSRPISMMEQTPWGGPARWMGNNNASAMYAQMNTFGAQFSPITGMIEQLGQVGYAAEKGKLGTPATMHRLRTLLPLRNMIWLQAAQRATAAMGIDNPTGIGKGIDFYPIMGLLPGNEPEYEATKRKREPRP